MSLNSDERKQEQNASESRRVGQRAMSQKDVMKKLLEAKPSWQSELPFSKSLGQSRDDYLRRQDENNSGQKQKGEITITRTSGSDGADGSEGSGGGTVEMPLQLYLKTVGEGEEATQQVWIRPGPVNGIEATAGELVAASGSGEVWAVLNYNTTTGEVTSVDIDHGVSMPESEPGALRHLIGYYDVTTRTVSNAAYGPLNASICRNWFAASAPYYNASWV